MARHTRSACTSPFVRLAVTSAAAALTLSALDARPSGAQPSGALPGWAAAAAFHRQQTTAAGIVGSSLVLVHGGAVVGESHAGHRETGGPAVDRDTIYHWASVTKTLTAIAIMQLRDRGLLSLDDPVVDHVPEFRRVHNPHGPIEAVTVRMIMSHSAGLRASTWPWGGGEAWHPFEPTEWAQLVAMLPYTDIRFVPGSRYGYSNPGILFLGRIIEQLSGDDYEVYVTKNILMPLGMHRSFFDRAPYHLLPLRSHSYFRSDEGLREARFDFDTGVTVSNGGLNAPMADMVRYLALLIGDPARTAEYDVVLSRRSLEEMWTPVLPAADGEGGSGDDVRIGLSFFVERHHGVELIGHSGNQNGFLSHLYLHPASRTGYLVAFNTDASSKRQQRPEITRETDNAVRDHLVLAGLVGPRAPR